MNKLWNHILRRRSNVDSEKLRRNTENKKGWEFHPMNQILYLSWFIQWFDS